MASLVGIILNFVLWSLTGFCILIIIPYTRNASCLSEIFNPKMIYDNIDVNWFGCIFLTIIFNILCPVLTIYYWFRLLCTVGRRY